MGTEAEVLNSLTGVLGSTEEQSVGTSGSTESKLVQSQSLTTSLLDSGASGGSETESSNRQLGNGKETVVVSDGSDHNNSLALVRLGNVGNQTRKRDRGTVDPGHEKAAEHDLVEVGVGTT